MADDRTTIQELIDRVVRFERDRDWEQFHSPKNLTMGMAIETGELMEHFLWIDGAESRQVKDDAEQLRRVEEEMADVLNYLLLLAHTLDIDLSDAFIEKMRRNDEKYPADKYRGKYKL